MKYISVQPATQYYGWQVETYLNNFQTVGIPMQDVIVVLAGNDPYFDKIKVMYPMVSFYHYSDDRKEKLYAPSIQPHILAKLWREMPELCDESVFYHDCDIVFTRYFDWAAFSDGIYMSNTRGYMGIEYIDSKGMLTTMCNLVGIDEEIIRRNAENVGGAQKILRNVSAEYWERVEASSNKLFNGLMKVDTDLQIWTASMWAELWELYKDGRNVIVSRDMDFCWATCSIDQWSKTNIMHNAGVVTNTSGMFLKSDYMFDLPYEKKLELDPNRCSYAYHRWVKLAGVKNRNFVKCQPIL